MTRIYESAPPIDRYLDKVAAGPDDACWPWRASMLPSGYGRFYDGERMVLAHRFAYETFVGPIPDGYYVCHTCDNPPCQNPAHLFTGSPADNVSDMIAKGRHGRVSLPGEAHPGAVLDESAVAEIRRLYLMGGLHQEVLADRFGVGQAHISRIIRGDAWRHSA